MSESAHQDLPVIRNDDRIELGTSGEQHLVIRKAAELLGWTVHQYVLSAALDRAERDLYEHAAAERGPTPEPDDPPEPFTAVVAALG
ncbi:DUF1778 domain-containing protein [Spirillospora sp. CA-294931]|uniref:type II toxin -antitoxin system TacA 1-like antitoxin n=1 Tax=Spirillospora sp. CA-294931 TaxID=3240042 RepID=UPI003D8F7B79